MNDYVPTIGIECHVQLKTKTKLFAPVGNDAREAPPNTLISHICLAMPGALPVLNKEAIRLAARAAYALNTKPQPYSYFERKHYFYPDSPMGYQISQLARPIIVGGSVEIIVDEQKKVIRINRAQLEADAGKNIHPIGKDYSLVDLNRAGTPLLEIVSEADIHSAYEAKAYSRELFLLMRYADVSDCNLYYGNMRFDVNVSVSKTDEFGIRTETKNLNSFRSIEKAVEYEVKRQIELLEKGKPIIQETRGWDDAKQQTFSQRSKEESHDYRYFPDPDIPPVVLDDAYIDQLVEQMPRSVGEMRERIQKSGASADLTETILDNPVLAHLISQLIESDSSPEDIANATQWIGQLAPKIALDNARTLEDLRLDTEKILRLASMFTNNMLSSTQAKTLFEEVILNGVDPEVYAKERDMLQVSDMTELEKIVGNVLSVNQKAAEDVRTGETKAIGFLVGQVMKESKGKANPGFVQTIIKKRLGV